VHNAKKKTLLIMPRSKRPELRRNTPNIKCEDCKEELEYMDEAENIAICPKCFTMYDLKKFKEKNNGKSNL